MTRRLGSSRRRLSDDDSEDEIVAVPADRVTKRGTRQESTTAPAERTVPPTNDRPARPPRPAPRNTRAAPSQQQGPEKPARKSSSVSRAVSRSPERPTKKTKTGKPSTAQARAENGEQDRLEHDDRHGGGTHANPSGEPDPENADAVVSPSFTQKIFEQNIRLRDTVQQRDDRIRTLETTVKKLGITISALHRRLEHAGQGISDITADSFSGKTVKAFADHIALDWFFCINPGTVCAADDELRPFQSPFPYIHWAPFFDGSAKYIPLLREVFLERQLLRETEAFTETFLTAYHRTQPTFGIKAGIFDKRRNLKSDKITKRIQAFLGAHPTLAILKGSEWRTSLVRPGSCTSEPLQCPFLNNDAARKLYDKVFVTSDIYKRSAPDASQRPRLVSVTQLGILDAIFKQKYEKKGRDVDYRIVATGSEKAILEHTKSLADIYFAQLKDVENPCQCCILIDKAGAPAAEVIVPNNACSQPRDETLQSLILNDDDSDDEEYDDTAERERLQQLDGVEATETHASWPSRSRAMTRPDRPRLKPNWRISRMRARLWRHVCLPE